MGTRFVIIVAAGSGSRMKSLLPKQFLDLQGRPVLMHTIERFSSVSTPIIIVVVLNDGMKAYWKECCLKHNFDLTHALVSGGETRFQSVRNGIDFIATNYNLTATDLIAIHDGARPLTDQDTIEKAFEGALKYHAIVVARSSTESVRFGNRSESHGVDRDSVWLVQTPQVFRADLLKKAYKQQEAPLFTDDASVVEKLGIPIHIIEGNPTNIKITHPEDLKIAELYLTHQST